MSFVFPTSIVFLRTIIHTPHSLRRLVTEIPCIVSLFSFFMAHFSHFRTAPRTMKGMPPGIPFIVGNEAAERFSFYGMKTILVVFMTQYLLLSTGRPDLMNETEARESMHLFVASAYFFPILGGIIADAFLGKYLTILILSLVYCGGHLCLALMDMPESMLAHTMEPRGWLLAGLALIAIGSGGIKPCVSAHVGDQFGQSNRHLLQRVFGWFYFAINFGSFFQRFSHHGFSNIGARHGLLVFQAF